MARPFHTGWSMVEAAAALPPLWPGSSTTTRPASGWMVVGTVAGAVPRGPTAVDADGEVVAGRGRRATAARVAAGQVAAHHRADDDDRHAQPGCPGHRAAPVPSGHQIWFGCHVCSPREVAIGFHSEVNWALAAEA